MIPMFSTSAQVLALLLLSLLLGAMFGIWRGYDPASWSASTFVEVHQGTVRGLNTLLPAMGLASIVIVVALAVMGRDRPQVLALYAVACILMVAAGLITRFGNQPINEIVMGWTPQAVPDNWTTLRGTWWNWHLARLGAVGLGELILIAAIFTDRSA